MEQREATTTAENDTWLDRLRSSLVRHTGIALMVIAVVAAAYAVSLSIGRPFNPGMVDVASMVAALLLPPFLLLVDRADLAVLAHGDRHMAGRPDQILVEGFARPGSEFG